MTAVDVRGRVDELADGTGGSVDAVTGRQSVHIGNRGSLGCKCPFKAKLFYFFFEKDDP
jgi:hypothetical protein